MYCEGAANELTWHNSPPPLFLDWKVCFAVVFVFKTNLYPLGLCLPSLQLFFEQPLGKMEQKSKSLPSSPCSKSIEKDTLIVKPTAASKWGIYDIVACNPSKYADLKQLVCEHAEDKTLQRSSDIKVRRKYIMCLNKIHDQYFFSFDSRRFANDGSSQPCFPVVAMPFAVTATRLAPCQRILSPLMTKTLATNGSYRKRTRSSSMPLRLRWNCCAACVTNWTRSARSMAFFGRSWSKWR